MTWIETEEWSERSERERELERVLGQRQERRVRDSERKSQLWSKTEGWSKRDTEPDIYI